MPRQDNAATGTVPTSGAIGNAAASPRARPILRAISTRAFRLTVVVALIASGAAAIEISTLMKRRDEATRRLEHTLDILAKTAAIDRDLEKMSGESRSFIITRRVARIADVDAAVAAIDTDLADLRALNAGNDAQLATVDRLREAAATRIAQERANMAFVAGSDIAHTPVKEHVGASRAVTLQVRAMLGQMTSDTERLLHERQAAATRAAAAATVGLIVGALLLATSAFCTVVVLVLGRRERRHGAEMRALNATLEMRVNERTAALATSEARQRGYFENAPIGLVVMRPREDGAFVHEAMNPAAAAIYGISRDDMLGRTLAQVWPESMARDIEHAMLACLTTGQPVRGVAARTYNGRTVLIDRVLAPLRDESGKVSHILACLRDVTERDELQRQVNSYVQGRTEAADREHALFRNTPDALSVIRVDHQPPGPEFVYEAISPAFEKLHGVKADDLIGMPIEESMLPEVAEFMLPHFRRCATVGIPVTFAATMPTFTGDRDLEGSLTPIRQHATGRVIRVASCIRDVTERNRMEAALRHSQKMEAIGRLAAGVAHDFNNILQAVISGLELALDDLAPGTAAQECASSALDAAQRGSYLTRHLLAYARKQVLSPHAVDLAPFLDEFQKVLARVLGPHVALEMRIGAHVPPMFVDPAQLQTALFNLAFNAAHAMPGGGTLTLSARTIAGAHTEDGIAPGTVILTVSDTGTGMDEATLAQATDPFFTTKGLDGTGLGLSMVKGFVEQSGGELRIFSAPGEGTSIEMRLPAAAAVEIPRAVVAGATPASGRVLLVDDAADVLIATGAFLTKAGFAVKRANSGDEALDVLCDERFDALVTDLAMPGMNGIDLISEARMIQPGLPALIITGFVDATRLDGFPAGVPVLHKPFPRVVLINTLRRLIAEHTRATGAPDRSGASRAGAASSRAP